MARLTKTGVLLAALLGVLGTARADLREAVRASDLAYLRALLAVPLPPDERDGVYEGDTALHLAAQLGNVEAVQMLLAAGATVDAEGWLDESPLHHAAIGGHANVAQVLLDHEADMNRKSQSTYPGDGTPVDLAIAEAQPEVLRLFVARGAEVTPEVAAALGDLPRVREAVASDGTVWVGTLLHCAAAFGQTEVVQFLLDSGVDVNSAWWTPEPLGRYETGATAIQRAAHEGQLEMVRLLRQHGAEVTIHQAAAIGDLGILQELLDKGADVNARDVEDEATPLHWAALDGRPEAMQLLLQRGAKIEAKAEDGLTPLGLAACAGSLAAVEYLVGQGADPGTWDSRALFCAIEGRRPDLVQLLLDRGAGANADFGAGMTPLHLAASVGNCEVISLLLARGAKVSKADHWGCTPLHEAAQNGQRRAAELLISNGAKLEEKTWLGGIGSIHAALLGALPELASWPNRGERTLKLTPLAAAAGCGYPATAATLIKHGADVNAALGKGDGGPEGDIGHLVVDMGESRVNTLLWGLLVLSGMDVPPQAAEVAAKVRSDTQLQRAVDALMAL